MTIRHRRIDPHSSAETTRNGERLGKSESTPARDMIEDVTSPFFKQHYSFDLVWGNTHARVGHDKADFCCRLMKSRVDTTSRRGVFARVRGEIPHHVLKNRRYHDRRSVHTGDGEIDEVVAVVMLCNVIDNSILTVTVEFDRRKDSKKVRRKLANIVANPGIRRDRPGNDFPRPHTENRKYRLQIFSTFDNSHVFRRPRNCAHCVGYGILYHFNKSIGVLYLIVGELRVMERSGDFDGAFLQVYEISRFTEFVGKKSEFGNDYVKHIENAVHIQEGFLIDRHVRVSRDFHTSNPTILDQHAQTGNILLYLKKTPYTEFMHTIVRTNIRRFVLTTALIIIATGFAAAQQPEPPVARSTARVEYVEGDVRIDGRPAQFGERVAFGALVQTASDGYVDIVFEQGNILRIDTNSVVRLSLNTRVRRINLRSGQLAVVAEGLRREGGGGGRRLILETPGTVAGVRGTLFFARVENSESTYICTCFGELAMEGPGFDPFNVQSSRHSARRFTAQPDGSIDVSEAGLLYHDDESMDTLAAKVGITVDWGNYSGYGTGSSY